MEKKKGTSHPLLKCDKVSLDLFWLRDESLESAEEAVSKNQKNDEIGPSTVTLNRSGGYIAQGVEMLRCAQHDSAVTRTASSINVLHCIIAHTAELPHIPIHLLQLISDFTRRLCKHGNTQSIAERIAGKLQQLGKQVETRPLNVVKNPEHYEALATSQARMTYSWKEDHKMEIQITHRPSYALAIATLTPNETINVEPGAAVSFSDGVTVQTHAQGGFFRGVKRMFGGEHISPRSPRLASIPVGVERKASLAERVSCS